VPFLSNFAFQCLLASYSEKHDHHPILNTPVPLSVHHPTSNRTQSTCNLQERAGIGFQILGLSSSAN